MNNSIPIFDSLTHPTIDGNWILPRYPQCASVENLKEQMALNNIKAAFAVGLKGIGGYEEDKFVRLIKTDGENKLYPVAFFEFDSGDTASTIDSKLKSIKEKGYFGIKLHPRIGCFLLDNPVLPHVIDSAHESGLIVFLCTYFYSNKQSVSINNIDNLGNLLLRVSPQSQIILLHGGCVRLLETAEIARVFPNVLLDLSFTLCKYEGSSVDMDIKYLFDKFDRRICVGSDHPSISLSQLRQRFDFFSRNTEEDKIRNIAFKNIEKLLIANR
jgi:predicted TIM-barrel fold metal-dependent hydrolase